jgi:hypothetical protein
LKVCVRLGRDTPGLDGLTYRRVRHAAACRPGRDIEPLPSNVNAGVRKRVIKGGVYRISAIGFDAIGKPSNTYKPATRSGTKQARMIELMRRPEGASIDEIVAETSWLPHTVRGTMTNALKKRLGLTLASIKADGEPRRYHIADGNAS